MYVRFFLSISLSLSISLLLIFMSFPIHIRSFWVSNHRLANKILTALEKERTRQCQHFSFHFTMLLLLLLAVDIDLQNNTLRYFYFSTLLVFLSWLGSGLFCLLGFIPLSWYNQKASHTSSSYFTISFWHTTRKTESIFYPAAKKEEKGATTTRQTKQLCSPFTICTYT